MKLLLISLLLAGAGAGSYQLVRPEAPAADVPCESKDCRVEVERISPDTCRVTCFDAAGDVVCQEEVQCDADCDKPCDRPCDKAAQSCDKPCEVPSSCSR